MSIEKKRFSLTRSYFFWFPISLLFVVLLSYGGYTYATLNRSLYGLETYGVDVGYKDEKIIDSNLRTINETIPEKKISIKYEDQVKEIAYKDLGIEIDVGETTKALRSFGKTGIWPNFEYMESIAKKGRVKLAPKVKWNLNPLDKINEVFSDSIIEPTNPNLTIDSSGVKIEPEKEGSGIDLTDTRNKIEQCLKINCNDQIIAQKRIKKSNILATDLNNLIPEVEEIIYSKIYFSSQYKNIYPKSTDLIEFIDEERSVLSQRVAYNDQSIDDYLQRSSKWFNVSGKNKVVSTRDGAVIDEGRAGLELDIQQSRENIKQSLNERKRVAELVVSASDIKEVHLSPGNNPGKFPGKFIEINLTEQNLYAFEGETLVATHKISSGKWSMPTPQGEYTINNKVERAYSKRYDLYMPYWMAFIGSEYGIHELPEWADGTKEGESHLGTPVSHGCVRLGRGSAESVYNWAEIGTIVFIHK